MIDLNSKHPFYSANDYYRELFGEKIIKLAINGGFSCPNRDGTLSTKGCIFCSGMGSGDFAGSVYKSIRDQYFEMAEKMSEKWKNSKYIVYFQSFTNTYAPIEKLRKKYYEALSLPNVVGLAIATRPDCINDDTLELLKELSEKTFIQIELGLQSTKNETVKLINRCYDNSVYSKVMGEINKLNIHSVTHIILGLPNESYEDILNSVNFAISCGTKGIKLQLLHILKSTALFDYYKKQPFEILTYQKYIDYIVNIISQLPPNIVVHRITGDANKADMFEPWWSLDKRRVLNGISKEFIVRNTYQGSNYRQYSQNI